MIACPVTEEIMADHAASDNADPGYFLSRCMCSGTEWPDIE